MSRTAHGRHTRGRSRRRKWPDSRDVPRQAGLLPRLGDVLGEHRGRAPLPRLATEWHARRQRRVVHRVYIHPHVHLPTFFTIPDVLLICRILCCCTRRASKEEPSQKRHTIVKNGYNLGRDWFVERALAGSHWKGHTIWWRAEVEWRTGLLEPGSRGASVLAYLHLL